MKNFTILSYSMEKVQKSNQGLFWDKSVIGS